MMKAVQIIGEPTSPRVTITQSHPKPSPKGTEILVHVHAAGLTADELLWPEVYARRSRIPGHDISGAVDSLGSSYDGPLKVGDAVFAMIAADRGEGQAEFVVCHKDEVALKPKNLGFDEAAALPIPVLTGWGALVEHGKIENGSRILVTGASGAVGSCFVQLAVRMFNAEVVALASRANHEMLKGLGAKETVDYTDPDWENAVKDVDMVFDTAGGDVLTKSWETVKERGCIVTVADPPPAWAFGRGKAEEAERHPGVRYLHFIVSPSRERLEKVTKMIEDGVVEPLPVKTFPFEEAVEAWKYAKTRNRGHKVVIMFDGGVDRGSRWLTE